MYFQGEVHLRLSHMKELTNETEPEIIYYATHHGIDRPEKSTRKLRVVFNCSSLTDNGISLNDIQYNGGVIQEDLYAQMLRFRTYTESFGLPMDEEANFPIAAFVLRNNLYMDDVLCGTATLERRQLFSDNN
ncbi:uncharacterized protein TNCV_607661 [Trichonephila clavipes]|nr:uncharacterized protein TNCV_607661 [Trichonephila clavipes]